MQYLFGMLLFLISGFLILLVLVQRGRGGGLAGAFGGMGGQSAFGTKAGDLFTRITIVVAALWIVLSIAAIKVLNRSQSVFGDRGSAGSVFGETDKKEGAQDGDSQNTPDSMKELMTGAGSASGTEGSAPAATSGAGDSGKAPAGEGAAAPAASSTSVDSAPATPPSAEDKK